RLEPLRTISPSFMSTQSSPRPASSRISVTGSGACSSDADMVLPPENFMMPTRHGADEGPSRPAVALQYRTIPGALSTFLTEEEGRKAQRTPPAVFGEGPLRTAGRI